MPKYLNVDTFDPDIVKAVRRMTDNGATVDEIQRVVGMPREVVERHKRDYENQKKRDHGIKPDD